MNFRLKIWDKHETLAYCEEDGVYYNIPHPTDKDWHKFYYYFDIDQVRILDAKEYVIFDSDLTPQRCMKIFLSGDKFVIGRYKPETYEKMYEEYLKIIPKTISDIVEDLKGKDSED